MFVDPDSGDFRLRPASPALKLGLVPLDPSRIVAASYLYSRFSSPQGWPELQRLGDLRQFALSSRPSDIQQFASPREEAELKALKQWRAERGAMQPENLLAHVPVRRARPGEPIVVAATLRPQNQMDRARLWFRENGMDDFRAVDMQSRGEGILSARLPGRGADGTSNRYNAVVPADLFDGQYDVMYYIEVVDRHGNGRMIPDMERETPYVVVHLERMESTK